VAFIQELVWGQSTRQLHISASLEKRKNERKKARKTHTDTFRHYIIIPIEYRK